jgi:hypothetical protein
MRRLPRRQPRQHRWGCPPPWRRCDTGRDGIDRWDGSDDNSVMRGTWFTMVLLLAGLQLRPQADCPYYLCWSACGSISIDGGPDHCAACAVEVAAARIEVRAASVEIRAAPVELRTAVCCRDDHRSSEPVADAVGDEPACPHQETSPGLTIRSVASTECRCLHLPLSLGQIPQWHVVQRPHEELSLAALALPSVTHPLPCHAVWPPGCRPVTGGNSRPPNRGTASLLRC